jgi:transposase InsO family protein
MELRLMAAVTGGLEGVNVAGLCRAEGVSRKTFYKWRARYVGEGLDGLEERSRRPQRSPGRYGTGVEDSVVNWHKELAGRGLDAGPATIRFYLSQHSEVPAPSEATIWRMLSRRGFVTPTPSKRPRSSYRRFEADRPNQRWQTDFTCWTLRDGTEVEILNFLDDHSRVALRSTACLHVTTEAVCAHFDTAATAWGLPTTMLSDNGLVFSGKLRGFEVAFEAHLRAKGIVAITSRPYHPQTCGKVERFQQTQKRWLNALRPRPATLEALQHALDRFNDHYNYLRPHRGIGRVTPITRWGDSAAAVPTRQALHAPRSHHNAVINAHGQANLRRWCIKVGLAHAGQPAHIVIDGHHAAIWIAGQLVRELTLDPTRRYQPLKPRPR